MDSYRGAPRHRQHHIKNGSGNEGGENRGVREKPATRSGWGQAAGGSLPLP